MTSAPVKGIYVDLEVPVGTRDSEKAVTFVENIKASFTVPELGLQYCSIEEKALSNIPGTLSLIPSILLHL